MNSRPGRFVAAAVLAASLLSAACTSDRQVGADGLQSGDENAPIVVGSFDFSESRVLADVYAVALEDHGYEVKRLRNVATREIMEPALEQGFVDFVPEYQGTALTFLSLGEVPPTEQPRQTHYWLRLAFSNREIAVFDYAPAENKNEVV